MKALILGLGKSGQGAARLLVFLGYEVFGFDDVIQPKDLKNIRLVRKTDLKNIIRVCNLVVVSPGVGENHPIFKLARKHKVKIINELELGFENFEGRVVAITGTDGKTTTTNLIDEILNQAGLTHLTAGNVGLSFSQALVKSKAKLAVLEVSSFQGRFFITFKPYIGIFLNLAPDHLVKVRNLAFHKNFKDYFQSKLRIFENQDKKDWLILNFDDARVRKIKSRAKKLFFSLKPLPKNYSGLFIKNGFFVFRLKSERKLFSINKIKLLGKHNLQNVMAAALAVLLLKIKPSQIEKALIKIKSFEHRIEFVRKIKDVEFYNDSKSTTSQAMKAALETLSQKGRGVLIAGGIDKGGNFKALRSLVRKTLFTAILIGQDKAKIKKAWQGVVKIFEAKTLKQAVNSAYKLTTSDKRQEAKWVLLSPACASFDMFKNYEDRGRQFKDLVRRL